MSDSFAPISYPVPWRVVAGIWPYVLNNAPADIVAISGAICSRIHPEPVVEGLDHLPPSPRFVLAANHYQRKGLWILHASAVVTSIIADRYGLASPPVRWVVTANWPPLKLGPWTLRSPGDILLPRVATAFCCYPVSFAGTNAAFTARSLRRILRDIPAGDRPLGLYPEGVPGSAGRIVDALPGVDRLLLHLARAGVPAVPCGISERGRFVVRFGATLTAGMLLRSADPAALVMASIRRLAS